MSGAALVLAMLVAGCATSVGSGGSAGPSPSRTTATIPGPEGSPAAPTASALPGEPVLGEAPVGPTERATVVRIVDGDTIVVDRGQGPEKLRYIGVDTPETVRPNTPVQFMGEEAAAANRALVEGRDVLLERDISEHDQYDRLLRYVWVADSSASSGWLLVNLALVARGFAQVVTYPPDVRYVDRYLAAQRSAREQGLGLWSASLAPSPTPAPTAVRGFVGDPRAGCDPAYPTVCISPPRPDLDCADVPYRRFEVLPPDPHRFDGNHDGVGCEGPG